MANRRTLLAYLMGTVALMLLGAGVLLVAFDGDDPAVESEGASPATGGGLSTVPKPFTLPQFDLEWEVPPDPVPSTVIGGDTTADSAGDQSSGGEAPADPEIDEGDVAVTPQAGSKEQSGPLVISGESGVVIDSLSISNPDGPCVEIEGSSDVVVRNSDIGPCEGRAVEVEESSSVSLDRLMVRETESGIYAVNSQGVSVTNSVFQDAGRNFVQFDKVTGSGNVIAGNTGGNRLGGSDAEDFVSVYQSSGTSGSPLRVAGNSFRDGGPSGSGSGIMVGDSGGSNIVVEDNILVNPGQVGIGVPGGTDIRVVGNSVFSSSHPWSNVGIYVWNQSDDGCSGIEVSGNRVEWYNSEGSANPAWDGGNCGVIAGWDDNDWDADLG